MRPILKQWGNTDGYDVFSEPMACKIRKALSLQNRVVYIIIYKHLKNQVQLTAK